MGQRGLYKGADGSWQQADAKKGVPLLYTLKRGERWTLLDGNRVMVIHPNRQPKIVCPDGRVEGIASKAEEGRPALAWRRLDNSEPKP